MNKHVEPVLMLLASALLIGSLVTGCKDISYPDPQPTSAAPNTSAQVRFANATPDANALTIYLENMQVGGTLGVGQVASYTTVPYLGSLQFRIKGAGGTFGSGDLSTKSTIAANSYYTAFVTDSTARPFITNAANLTTDVGGVRISVVNDPISQTLTSGSGGVRFFHFAPDVGVVSLRLVPTSPASVTAVQSINNRTYRTVTATAFNSVPAGTYTAQVFSGTATPAISSTVAPVLSVSGVTVETAKYYTLYAQGLARRRTLSIGRIQHN